MVFRQSDLHRLIEKKLSGHKIVVVANREPYVHRRVGGEIQVVHPAGGMASALDPVMQACDGIWIAHGSGDADREVVDEFDHVRVPPENPGYTLRRIWLTPEQEKGYYLGLANDGIWPLCHVTFTRPRYDPRDWEQYRAVNRMFADAVLQEVGDEPAFVFIQDFHFCLLPRMLREANPRMIIAQFWHIPWPNREVFRTFPWGEEVLDGLLGNDLLGFHVHYHCHNFLETVDRGIESRVDLDRYEVYRGGRPTRIRPFPISVDFDAQDRKARGGEVAEAKARWANDLNLRDGQAVGVGIERLDYTKGIPDRIRGLDYLFETRPEYRGRLRFVQIAVPSRQGVPAYQQISQEVDEAVAAVNARWRSETWEPVTYIREHQNPVDMMALHQLADFCVVSSLHDGMNLVAKEFIASRHDGDGVLILSRFTGSSRELGDDAVMINPFSIAEVADAIDQALTMPEEERRRRMERMRSQVRRNNVYRWAGRILSNLLRFDLPEPDEEDDR